MSAIQLRDYQRRAIDGLYSYFECKNGHPLIVAPTGSGKSVIIGALCKEILETWPNQRLMILSHVKELLEQNFSKIKAFWPQAPAGLYCAGLGQKRSRDAIVVGSIQSVYRKPHIFGWRDLILIDEAHLLSSDSDTMYRRFLDGIYEINPRAKVVGLTATAYRLRTGMLHEGTERLFTDIAVEISLQELLEAGHIAPLVSKSSVVQADLTSVSLVAGEFNARECEQAMDKAALTRAALDEVFSLASDRKSWLIFCTGVSHAEHVAEAIRDRGVSAATVTGETPAEERDAILRAFKAGELQAVTNCGVLTVGFDAPNIDLLVLLRPTTSPGLYVQIMGRGMRTAPGKANCLVLDFAGNLERHGPVTHVKPPRSPGTRSSPSERHSPTCLICSDCRMANPLGSLECAECGREFRPPERVKHDTTASTAEVMSLGEPSTNDLGEWFKVDAVVYSRHEKTDKPPSMKVEYQCGPNIYPEWICLEHPPGYAKAKGIDWWKRRYASAVVPDEIWKALHLSDLLKKPYRIRTKRNGNFWEITGYDFKIPTIEDHPAAETGMGQEPGEPIDFGSDF